MNTSTLNYHCEHWQQIAHDLNAVVKEMLETPFSCKKVESLWSFIQLSHSAPLTFIDTSFPSNFGWVRKGKCGVG